MKKLTTIITIVVFSIILFFFTWSIYGITDSDKDGLSNYIEGKYLNTDLYNKDSDEDGIGDADEDFDDDGLTNIQEIKYKTNPLKKDSDNDGINDFDEMKIISNPNDIDTDGDGMCDLDEYINGYNLIGLDF